MTTFKIGICKCVRGSFKNKTMKMWTGKVSLACACTRLFVVPREPLSKALSLKLLQ